ncbi:MAG: efflux RND transporter periplasmic adaptor subunit [Alphaproteobacteria bacterium]|nr:efflux RND transporter periplasmic adaptor subunit [Alphaproteobacteria bacterium]
MKKFLSIFTIFAALLLAVFFVPKFYNSSITTKIKVVPYSVSEYNIYETFKVTGQIKLVHSHDYYAQVKGRVDEVTQIQGARVKKGDLIIAIDKILAEKLKSQAAANLELSEMIHKGNLTLSSKKIINQEDISKSKAALENARSEHSKAIELYDNMLVKASQDGYVGVVRANVSDEVKIGDYLFSIIEEGDFNIFVELPENLRSQITTKDIVQTIVSDSKIIEGKVIAVSDYLSNNGTITAKIILPFSKEISHGSYVDLDIIYNAHKALAIPEKAVMQDNDGSFVYIITDENIAKKTYVGLGARCENMAELNNSELNKNITQSTQIVVEGLTKVKDGVSVEAIKEESKKDPR